MGVVILVQGFAGREMRGIDPQLRPVCCLGADLAVKDSDQILLIGPPLVSGPGAEAFKDFNDDRYPHRLARYAACAAGFSGQIPPAVPAPVPGPTAMLMAGTRQGSGGQHDRLSVYQNHRPTPEQSEPSKNSTTGHSWGNSR